MKTRDWALVGLAAVAVGALMRPETRDDPLERKRGAGFAFAPVDANRPSWRNLLVRTYREAMEDRLLAVAASVAFYALLAFVPALGVAVSLYGLFGDPGRLAAFPEAMSAILPADAVRLVQDQATRLVSESSRSLSLKLIASIAVSLWGASSAVKAVFDALNVIYETTESRSIVKLYGTALATTAGGVVVLLAAVAVIGAAPNYLAHGPFSAEAVSLFAFLRWPVFIVLTAAAIVVLYWIGPSRRPARFILALPGAMLSALLLTIVSGGFSWYVATIGAYSATYGSLAAVVIFMTWLWLSTAVVLFGAQMNFELERQRLPVGKLQTPPVRAQHTSLSEP
jgi:membrane protein